MAIRWEKLTVKAQEAVQRGNDLASEHGNPELLPLHLLAALLEDKEGIILPVLEKIGIGPQAVLSETYREIERLPKVSGGGAAQVTLSKAANELLERAFKEAANFKDEYVSTEHLLLAITHLKRDPAQEILARQGATYDAILKALTSVRGSQKVTDQNPEAKYQALERYARDLTEQARRGKLDPGHRPRRGNSPRGAGALPPHQEQSGADRRARRGQDRNRRRPGPAHYFRRRTRSVEEQARGVSRPGRDAGGRKVSRRI